MLINEYQSFLSEEIEIEIEPDEIEVEIDDEDFEIEDIVEILPALSQDELNAVGECIFDLVYDPEFDVEDIGEEEINEIKRFDTKKVELIRKRKRMTPEEKKKMAKKRKKYYKKNKNKLKRKNKVYRKKVKQNPHKVRHHI